MLGPHSGCMAQDRRSCALHQCSTPHNTKHSFSLLVFWLISHRCYAGVITPGHPSEHPRTHLFPNIYIQDTLIKLYISGLSHPFLGMGPGPLELGKIASFN